MSGDYPPNSVIIDESVIPEPSEESKRLTDELLANMDQAIGAPQAKYRLRNVKTKFTHAQISPEKRRAKRKAERQNKRNGR